MNKTICRYGKRTGAMLLPILMMCAVPHALSAQANDSSTQQGDEMTVTGVVTSSSPATLVVRSESSRYQLFVFDRSSVRPKSIATGSRVRVTSTPGDDSGVRVARTITVLSAPTTSGTQTAGRRSGAGSTPEPIVTGSDEVAPPSVRELERSIQRQVRKFQVGVRTGVALDPELVLLGAHAQIATGFSENVIFRPNIEFAFGELTTLFALNFEALYRLPVSSRQARWGAYVGAGPGVNFVKQGLTRKDRNVDFNDLDTDVSLNIFAGIQNRNGMFTELKTSVYASPSPSLRLIVGYNF